MSGLLERALIIVDPSRTRLRRAHDGNGHSPTAEVSEGVTADERRQLVADIERLFTTRRSIDSFGTERYSARHSGFLLPMLVNIISLTVLAAGILLLGPLLESFRIAGRESSVAVSTTEGLVVKELQRQASQALSERDARIAQIQRELERLRNAPPAAAGTAEAEQTRAREQQLTQELSSLQSDAAARLDALSAQANREDFLLRQLRSSYEMVRQDIASNDIPKALDGLSAADQLIGTAEQSGPTRLSALVPAVRSGNAAIRTALTAVQAASGSAEAAAELASRAAEIDRLNGKVSDLEKTIADLRSTIADQNTRLAQLQADANAQDAARTAAEQLRAQIARNQELLSTIAAQKDQLAQLQKENAGQADQLARQSSQLKERSDQISRLQADLAAQIELAKAREKRIQTLTSTMDGGLAQLRAAVAPDPAALPPGPGSKQVLDLLNTKVIIRQVAELAAARTEYPDLPSELDPFFQKYGDYFRELGRQAALDEVKSTVSKLDSLFSAAASSGPGAVD